MDTDFDTVHALNAQYVQAAQASDVAWYEAHLADDFMASNPDGTLLDKAGFLRRMAAAYPGRDARAVDTRLRFFGELAIVHSGFRFLRPDGREGAGRYTDVYAKRAGRWLCVSAHFNHCGVPPHA